MRLPAVAAGMGQHVASDGAPWLQSIDMQVCSSHAYACIHTDALARVTGRMARRRVHALQVAFAELLC